MDCHSYGIINVTAYYFVIQIQFVRTDVCTTKHLVLINICFHLAKVRTASLDCYVLTLCLQHS